MKRLLTYLFIVLGLGLVFSVNENSYAGSKKIYLCGEKSYREVSKMYNRVIISKIPCKKILSWRWEKISGKQYVKRVLDNYGNNNKVIQSLYDDFQSNNLDTSIIKKIAKTYPTQTQQVAKKEIKKPLNADDLIKILNQLTGYYKIFAYSSKGEVFWGWSVQNKKNPSLQSGGIISSLGYQCMLFLHEEKNSAPFNGKFNSICGNKNYSFGGTWKQHSKTSQGYGEGSRKGGEKITFYFGKDAKSFRAAINTYFLESLSTQTQQVVEKDETKWITKKKSKKKIKIKDEVSEEQRKEIKVKTKKKDTAGPEIEIAEAITVDDSSYTLKGKVSDKDSDKIYLRIDGEDIPIKRGKFKIERYSPVDEEVKIVAIDQWGNKSTKVVKVTIDIKEEMVVQKLEPLNPGRAKGKTSGEKVALIIGIENYSEAPKANYANLDAKYFFDYARKAFGAKKQNIKLLINEDATFVKTSIALTKWLRTRIKADQTDLIVFFAGHGLASSDGKELYLLPQDSDPDLLDITALSRTKLFQTIVDLKPKTVTMFLDTCYSGVSRDKQMLLASARPIRIVAGDEGEIPDNFTIFSATELDQISSGLKEAKHGIFSYYLMKGLEGKADANKNKEITNGELLAYMDINVSQKALELGRQQNPSLAGDPDQILMKY